MSQRHRHRLPSPVEAWWLGNRTKVAAHRRVLGVAAVVAAGVLAGGVLVEHNAASHGDAPAGSVATTVTDAVTPRRVPAKSPSAAVSTPVLSVRATAGSVSGTRWRARDASSPERRRTRAGRAATDEAVPTARAAQPADPGPSQDPGPAPSASPSPSSSSSPSSSPSGGILWPFGPRRPRDD